MDLDRTAFHQIGDPFVRLTLEVLMATYQEAFDILNAKVDDLTMTLNTTLAEIQADFANLKSQLGAVTPEAQAALDDLGGKLDTLTATLEAVDEDPDFPPPVEPPPV